MNINIEKMRKRFKNDKSFAEKFCELATEMTGFVIDDIWTKSTLPHKTSIDPAAAIVIMRGRNDTGHPFIMILVEQKEDIKNILRIYTGLLWEQYAPITDKDFDNLPYLYEIVFEDKYESINESGILHVRPGLKEQDGSQSMKKDVIIDDGVYINLINLNSENSEIFRLLEKYREG